MVSKNDLATREGTQKQSAELTSKLRIGLGYFDSPERCETMR